MASQSVATPSRGPRGNFLIGSIQDYSLALMGFTRRCADEYGDVVVFSEMLFSGVQLNHPDHIEEVFVIKRDSFIKDQALSILRLILGKGLLTSKEDFWQYPRRLMQPAFHRERMPPMAKSWSTALRGRRL